MHHSLYFQIVCVHRHSEKNTHTQTHTYQEIKRHLYKFIQFTIKDHSQWKLPSTAGTVCDTLSSRTNYTRSGSTKSFIELQTNTVKTFWACNRLLPWGLWSQKHTLSLVATFVLRNTVLLNNVLHYKSVTTQPSMMFFPEMPDASQTKWYGTHENSNLL